MQSLERGVFLFGPLTGGADTEYITGFIPQKIRSNACCALFRLWHDDPSGLRLLARRVERRLDRSDRAVQCKQDFITDLFRTIAVGCKVTVGLDRKRTRLNYST